VYIPEQVFGVVVSLYRGTDFTERGGCRRAAAARVEVPAAVRAPVVSA
jgi:hypothetical protein